MRAAKALDPSIHLGDTQAWLSVQTHEEDVVMKTDTRSRKGRDTMRAGNVWEFELMREAEVPIVPMTGTVRSRKQARHNEIWTNSRQRKELNGGPDVNAPEGPQHLTQTPGRHPRARPTPDTYASPWISERPR